MCPFKPGDEVVCVDDVQSFRWSRAHEFIRKDETYVVEGFDLAATEKVPLIFLVGIDADTAPETRASFLWTRFRKVQRRKTDLSIESFLTIKPGFEEPRRPKAPAKKERVS